jgi:hypothetical protein
MSVVMDGGSKGLAAELVRRFHDTQIGTMASETEWGNARAIDVVPSRAGATERDGLLALTHSTQAGAHRALEHEATAAAAHGHPGYIGVIARVDAGGVERFAAVHVRSLGGSIGLDFPRLRALDPSIIAAVGADLIRAHG